MFWDVLDRYWLLYLVPGVGLCSVSEYLLKLPMVHGWCISAVFVTWHSVGTLHNE